MPYDLISSIGAREAVAEDAHKVIHLLLQGLRDFLAVGMHRLQDRAQARARLVKRTRVAKQAEVGEDQLAHLGKEVAAFALHDRVHLPVHSPSAPPG